MTTLRFTHRLDAPPTAVWPVVADHATYGDVAPNLRQVEVLEGAGVGMRRRCVDSGGRAWSETCTLWDEGNSYAFEVDTDAPDYPYPLRRLRGRWSVLPAPGGGSTVELHFEAEPRGLLGRLALMAARPAAPPIVRRLFRNWEREIAARERAADTASPRRRLDRRRPRRRSAEGASRPE